ncbi:MAG: GNAT family N-acetyltransferase [Streptosporangiales bacterium]
MSASPTDRSGYKSSPIAQVLSPAPRSAWQQVLETDPGATALQTTDYFDAVLKGTGGRDRSRLYIFGDGRRVVLPLVRQKSVPGLCMLAGYPGGFGHGSALASGGLRTADVRAVIEQLRGTAASIRIDGGHHTAEQWSSGRPEGVTASRRRIDVIDLPGGWQDHFPAGLGRDARYHVRKAQRRGVEVERDTAGRLIPIFYALYLEWVDRWVHRAGLPPVVARYSALRQEPRSKYETVAAGVGQECRVFIAWHRGRAVAGCITLVHGNHAIGWRSYSIKELSAPCSANTLVQASAICDAATSGCRYFDLGQSGDAATLQRYKLSLGATPRWATDVRIETRMIAGARKLTERTRQWATRVAGTLAPRARVGYGESGPK